MLWNNGSPSSHQGVIPKESDSSRSMELGAGNPQRVSYYTDYQSYKQINAMKLWWSQLQPRSQSHREWLQLEHGAQNRWPIEGQLLHRLQSYKQINAMKLWGSQLQPRCQPLREWLQVEHGAQNRWPVEGQLLYRLPKLQVVKNYWTTVVITPTKESIPKGATPVGAWSSEQMTHRR